MLALSARAQPPNVLRLLADDVRWNLISALSGSDLRVHELVAILGQPMNLVSYHLKQLRAQQLVTERRSSADGRDVYYSLDLDALRTAYRAAGEALHPALTEAAISAQADERSMIHVPTRVLFLCTHNSARSQMAEGILRQLGGRRVEVFSAGSQPSDVHPDAVRVLEGMGIDISRQQSKALDDFVGQSFDYIITVCDRVREVCPIFPDDPERIHWSFPDPATIAQDAERYRAFEQTARQLVTRIHHLLISIDRRQKGNGG